MQTQSLRHHSLTTMSMCIILGANLPTDCRREINQSYAKPSSEPSHQISERTQRRSGAARHAHQRGAHPGRHLVARDVA